MKKFLFLVALLFAAAIAEDATVVEDNMDADLVEPLADVETFVEVSAKLASSDRANVRAQLKDMWATNNLDISLLSEQELLEEKTGKGYGEMEAIMKKVDELEKKIQEKIVNARNKYKIDTTTCRRNKATINGNIARLSTRIRANEKKVLVRSSQIDNSNNKKKAASVRITTYQKQVSDTNDERDNDYRGYVKRKNKRMKEIFVLQKAMALICTFTDFLKSEVCITNVVGRKLETVEPKTEDPKSVAAAVAAADKALESYQKDFNKTMEENEEKIEEGKYVIPKVAVTVKKTDTAETLLEMSTENVKNHQMRLLSELNFLMNSEGSDVSLAVAKPVRMVINFVETGTTSTAEDPNSLPVLLWNLFTRISTEMKTEASDLVKLLDDYKKRTDDLQRSIFEEVEKQKSENEAQIGFNRDIIESQKDIASATTELGIQSQARQAEYKRCYDLMILYRKDQTVRYRELVNITELRSLLRVLQNSDLPKCADDCTRPEQGKCIWKGLFGKDSFCRCKAGFYGKACEMKKCPGDSGLLQHDQNGVCFNHGTCDSKTGQCACKLPYFHGATNGCELKHCPDKVDKCGGPSRGKCNTGNGICECTTKYHGSTCQYTKCPGTNNQLWRVSDRANACNGSSRGACDPYSGNCKCGALNYGTSCQYFKCHYDCYGRGTCNAGNGTCACNSRYTGAYCQSYRCPNNCSGRGRCLPNGQCACDAHRVGKDCRKPGWCNKHDVNVFYRGGMNWYDCPSGHFIVGFKKAACRGCNNQAIAGIRQFVCARPCDENKTSFERYTKLDRNYCRNDTTWWGSFDRSGLSKCSNNEWIAGIRKNYCNALYCIEEARCCGMPPGTQQDAKCVSTDWSSMTSTTNESVMMVPEGSFLRGLERDGGWGIEGIQRAESCYYTHRD